MRDQSQIEDMRTAIRGDFERLAERRGGQELMRVAERPPEPEPDRESESEDPGSRSWLARLLSRWAPSRQV